VKSRIARLCFLIFVVFGSSEATAQSASDIMKIIGGIANHATTQSVRNEWKKISNDVLACADSELRESDLSVEKLIQHGTQPSDARLKPLFDYCKQKSNVTTSTQPAQAQFGQVRRPGDGEREIFLRRWSQLSPSDRICIEQSLQEQQGVRSVDDLIRLGIPTSDLRVQAALAQCQQKAAQERQASDAEDREIARRAAQIAADTQKEIEERNRKEEADKEALRDAEAAQVAAFQEAEKTRQTRNQHLLVVLFAGAALLVLLFSRKFLTRMFKKINTWTAFRGPLSLTPTGIRASKTAFAGKWALLLAIIFVLSFSKEYFGSFTRMLEMFEKSPIALASEIKTNPRSPTDQFGILVVRNLSDQVVAIDRIQINKAKSPNCYFKAEDALALGGSATLKPGDSVVIGNAALLIGSCGPITSVTITSDKGSVTHEYRWTR